MFSPTSRSTRSLAALPRRSNRSALGYAVQAQGRSPDENEVWLNWIIRLVDTAQAAGYVQATVSNDGGRHIAEIAWVVGSPFRGRRAATKATVSMCLFLVEHGVERLLAHVHPDHPASQGVARAAGLHPTDELVDGEVRWIADVVAEACEHEGPDRIQARGTSASWRL